MSLKNLQPHVALSNPQTKLEKAAAKLEKKLSKLRSKDNNPQNSGKLLVPAEPEDLKAIQQKWKLPKYYLEFLEKFSPWAVWLDHPKEKYGPTFYFYGADELIERQGGYAWNAETLEPFEDWPKNFIVIGDHHLDPFCIDISDGDDPAVYFSEHELGAWEFDIFEESFTDFLKLLAKKGYPLSILDEIDEVKGVPQWGITFQELDKKFSENAISLEGFAESRRAWKQKDAQALINSLMSLNIGVLSVEVCKLHTDRLERLQEIWSTTTLPTETDMEFFLRSKNRALDFVSSYAHSDDSETVFVIAFTNPRSFKGGF